MSAAGKSQPIIVIKKKGGHGGHHGGAWKVAYADFVTAMMSLFIVLWLMNSSEKIKKAVAGYFNDPKGTSTLMGTTVSGTGETVTAAATTSMEQLKERIEQGIKARKDLEKLSKQIEMTITAEGLRIELLEDKNGTFYEIGSARLSNSGQELLALLAGELKTLPNALLIEGHTDATQYSSDATYTNWELSADRANAARRLMQQDGVRADQVSQVRGYADQMLRMKNSPFDPSNRRISILVKNDAAGRPPVMPATAAGGERGSKELEPPKTVTAERQQPEAPRPGVSKADPGTATPKGTSSGRPAKAGLLARVKNALPWGSK
jgi:chemotaxis protein MotB